MSTWVVVADASRARILETRGEGASLVELNELVHPASRLHERDLVSDRPGSGRTRPAGGGVGHSVGHEHDATRDEEDRFAREVATMLDRERSKGSFTGLHVFAAPSFLGSLRAHLGAATQAVVASEHALDVTGETPEQIQARIRRKP